MAMASDVAAIVPRSGNVRNAAQAGEFAPSGLAMSLVQPGVLRGSGVGGA
jgi:hypothetical protein